MRASANQDTNNLPKRGPGFAVHGGTSDDQPTRMPRFTIGVPPRVKTGLLLCLCLLACVWVRWPTVGAGMPYFYAEDEAHHFNRVVDMVKKGELNPHYFHKPSLHFYLRMPVVAFAFLLDARKGGLKSVQEIRTRDPQGLGGYAFTASHPGIVKWNRLWSLTFVLLAVALSFWLAVYASGSIEAGALAGALVAVAPELTRSGSVIGVDSPMMLFCLASACFAAYGHEERSSRAILLSSVAAGLAVSTKYNALPVVAVPMVASLLAGGGMLGAAKQLVICVAAFFAGSPFILAELPLFLDQFAYEIWHYGVAGHVGHTAEPGLEQALHHLRWLAGDGAGVAAVLLAASGIVLLARSNWRLVACMASFPILFFALMAMQKANFARNMLPLIPFAGVFAGIGIAECARRVRAPAFRGVLWAGAALSVVVPPLLKSTAIASELSDVPESRRALLEWIEKAKSPDLELAVAGSLQLPAGFLASARATRFNDKEITDLSTLYLDGQDAVVTAYEEHSEPWLTPLQSFPGAEAPQRVIQNPAIHVYGFQDDVLLDKFASDPANRQPLTVGLGGEASPQCKAGTGPWSRSEQEQYCWIQQRLVAFSIENMQELAARMKGAGFVTLSFDMMSPWKDQKVELRSGEWRHAIDITSDDPDDWQTVIVQVPANELFETGTILVAVQTIRQAPGADKRRLGVAIRAINAL